MIYSEVIIVGGGPAGSTCAWKLRRSGIECLILDKEEFPRHKLCAGWITPKVVKDLEIDFNDYPHGLVSIDKIYVNIFGVKLKIKTHQYSIRRYEFDDWLLKRAGVPVYTHYIENIRKENDRYIIDDRFCCRYLIGAGGTFCPVYRTFFEPINPRAKANRIVALEEEFKYAFEEKDCHLWFFENKLPGYSWYVPKGNGYLNIGVGGISEGLRSPGKTIQNHWNRFVQKLSDLSLVKEYNFNPKGCLYYLRDGIKDVQIGNAFVIGDAAGLATRDLGVGIGPAVKSGLLAADAIINGKKYDASVIKKYSIPQILASILKGGERRV